MSAVMVETSYQQSDADGSSLSLPTVKVKKTPSVKGVGCLDKMPLVQLQAVLAHELCHCFLCLRNFSRMTPAEEEGLCELFRFLWLSHYSESASTTAERSPDEENTY